MGTQISKSKKYVFRSGLAFGLFASLLPAVSLAHHPMGGDTPVTFTQGLLSGVGHPLLGLDHWAFIVAAGILAWKLGKPLVLLTSFIIATAVGSLAISSGLAFSFIEPLILLSLAVIGFALARKKLPAYTLAQVFYPIAGFFHGCAYGDAVIGAEATPIAAYLIGFALTQFAIAYAASQTVSVLARKSPEVAYARLAGALICGIALTYGVEMAETTVFGAV